MDCNDQAADEDMFIASLTPPSDDQPDQDQDFFCFSFEVGSSDCFSVSLLLLRSAYLYFCFAERLKDTTITLTMTELGERSGTSHHPIPIPSDSIHRHHSLYHCNPCKMERAQYS